MRESRVYLLVAFVYMAPHTSPNVALGIALPFLLVGFVLWMRGK
ncbi:hypothetical protein AVE30378_05627 [Achromobacter veterisilvae]|uniref:Uncharacterized protein n=1 Tax=Achromobacter veterisilvae TaxID=2069367 RepID=A0A446CZP5_9BURK|nr:hypothetical protein AVE30378_05627 [Achromobacter veterisilvae]